jgi:hypothetical protein
MGANGVPLAQSTIRLGRERAGNTNRGYNATIEAGAARTRGIKRNANFFTLFPFLFVRSGTHAKTNSFLSFFLSELLVSILLSQFDSLYTLYVNQLL